MLEMFNIYVLIFLCIIPTFVCAETADDIWDEKCLLHTVFGNVTQYGEKTLDFIEPNLPYERDKSLDQLKICILNQRNGGVIFYEKFPVHKLYGVWMVVERSMKNLSPARIVILSIQGRSIAGLRDAVHLFTSFGSAFAEHLSPYSSWTWVLISGGKTIFEKVVDNYHLVGKQTEMSNIQLLLSSLHYPINVSPTEKRRWLFCAENGVFGELCDEASPYELEWSGLKAKENILLKNVPVIVSASNRAQYLYQSLISYLKSNGVVKENILVLLSENTTITTELLEIMKINYSYILPKSYGLSKFLSFRYYRSIYKYTYDNFPNSSFAIFLDEDVEVAADFFSYLSQVMHLLIDDPTLFCATALSACAVNYKVTDETKLLRGIVQVGWGYILLRSVIKEIFEGMPPEHRSNTNQHDAWILNLISRDRECIYPEVNRARHFGHGINTQYDMLESQFLSTPLSNSKSSLFNNTSNLKLRHWKRDLHDKIKNSIQLSANPCQRGFFNNLLSGSYVMYFNQTTGDPASHLNSNLIKSCFWYTLLNQGYHDSVYIIRMSEDLIFYLVGYPESSLSHLKLSKTKVIDYRSENEEDNQLYMNQLDIIQSLYYIKLRKFSSKNIMEVFAD